MPRSVATVVRQVVRRLIIPALIVASPVAAQAGVDRAWVRAANGSANWASGGLWSPVGVPQLGDGVFVTATDSFSKVVIFDNSSAGIINHFTQLWVDESGPGNITLQQNAQELLSPKLNVGVSGPATYDVRGGSANFGTATIGGPGTLLVAPGAIFNPTIFQQNGGRVVNTGSWTGNTYILAGGSFTMDGTYNSFNFTQTGGTLLMNAGGTLGLSGTYNYNTGVVGDGVNKANGNVNAGTFVFNNPSGVFGGWLDTQHLIVNLNTATFLGGLINRGAINVPASQTLWNRTSYSQMGNTVTQNGFIGGAAIGQIGGDFVDVNVGGGSAWAQQGGLTQGARLNVGLEAGDSVGTATGGIYQISGGSINVANISIGPESDGALLQTGGLVQASGMALGGFSGFIRGNDPVAPGGRAYYQLTGGTLALDGMVVAAQDCVLGQYSQSGGIARLTNGFVCNVNSTTTGTVSITGGTFVAQGPTINNGTFNVAGTGSALVNANVDGAGTINVSGNGWLGVGRIRQDAVQLDGNGQLDIFRLGLGTIGGVAPVTHRVHSLSFGQSGGPVAGHFNLVRDRLVVDYSGSASPIADIRRYLASGYNGGHWNGPGLDSSPADVSLGRGTTLGCAEASQVLGPNGGLFVDLMVDSTAVLVKYTVIGDSNLDGTVDLTDFTFLAGNFNGTNKSWLQGDYNYDGKVDLTDFTFLTSNFNQSLASDALIADGDFSLRSSFGSSVPEPTAALLATLLALASRRRVRRKT